MARHRDINRASSLLGECNSTLLKPPNIGIDCGYFFL